MVQDVVHSGSVLGNRQRSSGMKTDVLIVGGGPVGMTCSALLAQMGVENIVIDRKDAVSYYPKARAINARSMEIFRQLGLEEAISTAMPSDRTRNFAIGRRLVPSELEFFPFGLGSLSANPLTPVLGSFCTQDRLEPILFDHLGSRSCAELMFGNELIAFTQHETGVSAMVHPSGGGKADFEIEAQYIVGADGSRRTCAELANIAIVEQGEACPMLTIIFKAPLAEIMAPLKSVFVVLGDRSIPLTGALAGVPLARDENEWSLLCQCDPDLGIDLSRYKPEITAQLVRKIIGLPDLPIAVTTTAIWWKTAAVAESFVANRLALIGDCAHLMPPAAGLGMNAGLLDAHNLAWRLAALTRGAGPSLLDGFDRERRTEVGVVLDAAMQNDLKSNQVTNLWDRPQWGVVLGAQYHDGDVAADGSPGYPRAYPYYDYEPTGRPGERAPHMWLDAAQTSSILDLYGTDFVLLAESEQALAEFDPLPDLRAARVVRYALEAIAGRDGARRWRHLYGVEPGGGVLVRPDGVVGWRGMRPAGPRDALLSILRIEDTACPERSYA